MSASQPHPAREELFAYRDGELKHDRRVVIEAHVLGCHICRELIDEVSRMEADLGAGAPVPKDAYFERLSEQVMSKVAAADTKPSVERRRPEGEAEWEDKRAKPKLSWLAITSTASAAAAVIVVGVLLVREGAVWRRAPSVAVLERSGPDAARSRASSDSASRGTLGGRSEGKKRADQPTPPPASAPTEKQKEALGKLQSKTEGNEVSQMAPVDLGSGAASQKATTQEMRENANQKVAGDVDSEKDIAMRKSDSSTRAADELALRQAPSAALAPSGVAEPVGGELKSLLDRYGLPPVWGPGVSDEQVLRAEPALRNLYRIGGAASAPDSARVRLYMAEAARVRAGATPDSAAVDEIVHHYRRAIRLAGNDAAIRGVAAERLQDFLNELGDEPALHSP